MGTVAEWVSGLGALTASVVALGIAGSAGKVAREDRGARVRERRVDGLSKLLLAVETDRAASSGNLHLQRSPEGRAACWALFGDRGSFGTAWHYYCEKNQN